MNRMSFRRLRSPIFALLFGSMISSAIGIGQSWIGAAFAYVVTAIFSTMLYVVGWGESPGDASAVIGGREDERQELVRLRAAHVGLITAIVATGIACLVSAIVKATFWPYEVIVDVVAVSYLIGLHVHGVTVPSTDGPDHSERGSANA
jgi:hypothetical protein